MLNHHPFYCFLIVLLLSSCQSPAPPMQSLKGYWLFQTDPKDVGINQQWYRTTLSDSVHLPGSMKENLKGEIPNLKTHWTGSIYDSSFYFNKGLERFRTGNKIYFPFWLTPCRYYRGAAWYQREITIPKSWNKSTIQCILERVHWQSSVWLDDHLIGSQNSLSTPHVFDLSQYATPGKHRLTLRIDNRLDSINVGPDANSVTDHTQGNWNGMIGHLVIRELPAVHIQDLQIYPQPVQHQLQIRLKIHGLSGGRATTVRVQVIAPGDSHFSGFPELKKKLGSGDSTLIISYPMKKFRYWNEFHPFCYRLKTQLKTGKKQETRITVFGMREIRPDKGHFLLNGKTIFLRGTVNNCVFPETGYPPMNVSSWIKLFQIYKECGLNAVRFHSWCPPKAAFEAADSLGIYLQPEAPLWANHGSSLGNGQPVDRYLVRETSRIFRCYGNHPSFLFYSFGNEPRGPYVHLLDSCITYFHSVDNRRLYTASSIGMSWKVNSQSQYLVRSAPRGLPFHRHQPSSDF